MQQLHGNRSCFLVHVSEMPQHSIRMLSSKAGLLKDDFVRLGRHWKLEGLDNLTKESIVEIVANKASDGDETFVAQVVAAQCGESQTCPMELLANDPMFEYVFDELDPEDKKEFADVKDPLQTAKLRQKVNDSRIRRHEEGPPHKKMRLGLFAKQNLARAQQARASRIAATPEPPVSEMPPQPAVPEPPPPMPPQPAVPEPPPPAVPAEPLAADPSGPAGHREHRCVPFGRNNRFLISHKYSAGRLIGVHATCKLHTVGETKCNKTLDLGNTFSLGAATRRIQKWCLDGVAIANDAGGKGEHMSLKPRYYVDSDVPSDGVLAAIADHVL